jgi:hypothetical protein
VTFEREGLTVWYVVFAVDLTTDDGSPLNNDVVSCNTDRSLLDRERVFTDPRGHDRVEVWV